MTNILAMEIAITAAKADDSCSLNLGQEFFVYVTDLLLNSETEMTMKKASLY